nr:Crp/Fnr family transcriptional regulator [Pleomorphomonas sp. NRK KF1]
MLEIPNRHEATPTFGHGSRCEACPVRQRSLFGILPADRLDGLLRQVEEAEYAVGDVIYSTGERRSSVFTLRSGYIKLLRFLPDGQQRIVRLLKPSCTFGLEALMGDSYGHSAVVLERAAVCRISTAAIDGLRRNTPALHDQLMRRWQIALEEADAWLTELSTGKAPQRFSRLLCRMVDANGLAPLFSREDLGAMLAVTPEHASRMVVDFRRNGAIVDVSPGRCRCNVTILARLAAGGE